MKFENCELDEMGWWFTFSRSKQRSMVEESSICVPRRQADWSSCVQDSARRPLDYDPASLIDLYFEQLMIDFGCQKEDLKGFLFKGCHGKDGKRFTNVNVGKNTLGYFGVEIASELLLPHPETFTGHCWRRSAGTNASNAGVNVTTLMSIMGWRCPKTAMEYVNRSRITSLQMSMYLTNVQRQNCSVPFPSNASDRRRKTLFPSVKVPSKGSLKTVNNREFSFSQEEGDEEAELLTQDLDNVCPKESSNVGHDDMKSESDLSRSSVDGLISHVDSLPISISGPVSGNNVVGPSPLIVDENSNQQQGGVSDINSLVDSRLSSFLSNLQNHGNVHIHFHFDKK